MQHPVPEQFTKPPEIDTGERRLRVRRSPSALTYVSLGENNGGIVANISETGMYVTAGEPLRENFLSRVSFRLPQSNRAIETGAEVVWTSESNKEAGVRFVDLEEESREEIRNWISPRRNGKSIERPAESMPHCERENHSTAAAAQPDNPSSLKPVEKLNGHAADVESRDQLKEPPPATHATQAPAAQTTSENCDTTLMHRSEGPRLDETVLLQRLAAASGSGPKSWAFTAAQRAEFERLFPSEVRNAERRESAAPEVVAQSELVIEPVPVAAPSFVAPIANSTRQPIPAPAFEQAAAPPAPPARVVAPDAAEAAPVWRAERATTMPGIGAPRMPMQSLWDAPPRAVAPIIGGNDYGFTYGEQAEYSESKRRPRSLWSVAALAMLLVAACFALGFAAGPHLTRNWPKIENARQAVLDEVNHAKAMVTGGGESNNSNSPAVAPHTSASDQAAPSAQIEPSTPATGAPIAPDTTTPPAENAAPDTSAPSESATANAADENPDVAGTPPASTESTPAPSEKRHSAEPSKSTTSALASHSSAKEKPVEKPYTTPEVKAGPTTAVTAPRVAAPPPAASMSVPENSTPRNNSSIPSGSTSTGSAPSASASAKAPSAPPTRAAEPAAHPAALPPSYFPVVAPAAGNVPRLIELPEEKVIDTAAVVIHSREIVFVPAEPGPESSHKLEKLQIGDRVTKLAPTYPPQAAQKGMGGTVHLRAIIGKDGNVQDVRPINGPITLIPAAVEAIRQWQYRPTLLDQQPIEMQEDFSIEFRPLGVQVRQ